MPLLQKNFPAARASRLQARVDDELGLYGDVRPVRIGLPAEDEFAEAAEEFGLLRGGMAVGVFVNGDATAVTLHVEPADFRLKAGLLDFKTDFGSVKGQYEIPYRDVSGGPAYVEPLLVLGLEAAIETRGDAAGKINLGGEGDRDSGLAYHTGTDRQGHGVTHRPERNADAVPAEITEAAQRLQSRLHADVLREKTLRRHEAELRGDAFDFADGVAGIEFAPQGGEAVAVHEHDAVHELHLRFLTGLDDLAHLARIDPAWLLAEDVFAGGGGGEDILLA